MPTTRKNQTNKINSRLPAHESQETKNASANSGPDTLEKFGRPTARWQIRPPPAGSAIYQLFIVISLSLRWLSFGEHERPFFRVAARTWSNGWHATSTRADDRPPPPNYMTDATFECWQCQCNLITPPPHSAPWCSWGAHDGRLCEKRAAQETDCCCLEKASETPQQPPLPLLGSARADESCLLSRQIDWSRRFDWFAVKLRAPTHEIDSLYEHMGVDDANTRHAQQYTTHSHKAIIFWSSGAANTSGVEISLGFVILSMKISWQDF